MDNRDRQLWDLLGRAPRAAAPPFFAARVMRAVEATPASPHAGWFAGALRWLAPATVAALVLVALIPRTAPTDAGLADNNDITTLELIEFVNPDDYIVLTSAGWPYDNGALSAGL